MTCPSLGNSTGAGGLQWGSLKWEGWARTRRQAGLTLCGSGHTRTPGRWPGPREPWPCHGGRCPAQAVPPQPSRAAGSPWQAGGSAGPRHAAAIIHACAAQEAGGVGGGAGAAEAAAGEGGPSRAMGTRRLAARPQPARGWHGGLHKRGPVLSVPCNRTGVSAADAAPGAAPAAAGPEARAAPRSRAQL